MPRRIRGLVPVASGSWSKTYVHSMKEARLHIFTEALVTNIDQLSHPMSQMNHGFGNLVRDSDRM